MSLTYDPAGSTPGTLCLPLPDGVTTNGSRCMVEEVNIEVIDNLQFDVAGMPEIVSRTGPTMLGIALQGRGLPCGSADGHCYYRTIGAQCAGTIIQSGSVGQTVEAVLSQPCTLQHRDAMGQPTATLTVRVMRLRGTLRLTNETTVRPDGSVPFADCGL